MLQIVQDLSLMAIQVIIMRLRMGQVFQVEEQLGGQHPGQLVWWVQGHVVSKVGHFLTFLHHLRLQVLVMVLHLHLGMVHLLQVMVINLHLVLTWKARRTLDHGWTLLFLAPYLVLSRWMEMVGQ